MVMPPLGTRMPDAIIPPVLECDNGHRWLPWSFYEPPYYGSRCPKCKKHGTLISHSRGHDLVAVYHGPTYLDKNGDEWIEIPKEDD